MYCGLTTLRDVCAVRKTKLALYRPDIVLQLLFETPQYSIALMNRAKGILFLGSSIDSDDFRASRLNDVFRSPGFGLATQGAQSQLFNFRPMLEWVRGDQVICFALLQ